LVRHEDTLKRMAQSNDQSTRVDRPHMIAFPMHFSAGRSRTIVRLMQGGGVYIQPPLFTAAELVETVRRVKPTHLSVVPTVLRGLLDYAASLPEGNVPLLPDLDTFTSGGGASLPAEKRAAKRLLSEHYTEGYASSLCGSISHLASQDVDEHAETVGRVGAL